VLLDAACTVADDRTGSSETYYLVAPCRAERMFRSDYLFQMPNYEFCGIYSADECLLLRTHWSSDRDNREYARNRERFDDVQLHIRHLATPTTGQRGRDRWGAPR